MCRRALLLLLCLLACAVTPQAAAVQPYCGALTGVAGCVECSATKLCYFCNYLSSPVWTSPGPKLTECRALSGACRGAGLIGGVTLDATFGKYCAACESKAAAKPFAANRCVRCLPNYGLDATNKCTLLLGTTGTGLDACRRTSMNAGCAECNPDGTCRRCTTAGAVLMPSAAIWLDAGYPETQCLVTTSIQTEAKKVVGTAGNVVAACAEVDLDFNCVACMQPTAANLFGWGPKVDATDATGKKIACVKNGGTTAAPISANSGCLMKTPYMQYCKKASTGLVACDATRTKCLAGQCMGGRSVDANGQCSLNCKGMFGISCTACTATACTALDATFKSGR
ncbi:hypothetical protein COHA_005485 [Chlorella ohadii]|uniref:Uncharacterized protein n=1 Tax=Chlorella ohadii TaxID=2649997 RepID=A0AAD5DUV1_9CHLO|nr:hypothetical protein COHA_005485 [Chlorella ohadii]